MDPAQLLGICLRETLAQVHKEVGTIVFTAAPHVKEESREQPQGTDYLCLGMWSGSSYKNTRKSPQTDSQASKTFIE